VIIAANVVKLRSILDLKLEESIKGSTSFSPFARRHCANLEKAPRPSSSAPGIQYRNRKALEFQKESPGILLEAPEDASKSTHLTGPIASHKRFHGK
jgi:hypothetical protein